MTKHWRYFFFVLIEGNSQPRCFLFWILSSFNTIPKEIKISIFSDFVFTKIIIEKKKKCPTFKTVQFWLMIARSVSSTTSSTSSIWSSSSLHRSSAWILCATKSTPSTEAAREITAAAPPAAVAKVLSRLVDETPTSTPSNPQHNLDRAVRVGEAKQRKGRRRKKYFFEFPFRFVVVLKIYHWSNFFLHFFGSLQQTIKYFFPFSLFMQDFRFSQ